MGNPTQIGKIHVIRCCGYLKIGYAQVHAFYVWWNDISGLVGGGNWEVRVGGYN